MKEFGCSQEVATLGLSLFVVGLGIGPMVLGPLSGQCDSNLLSPNLRTKPAKNSMDGVRCKHRWARW